MSNTTLLNKQHLIDFLKASRVFVEAIATVETVEEKAFIATQYALLNKANEAIMSGLMATTSKEDTKKLVELFDEAANDLNLSEEELMKKLQNESEEITGAFTLSSLVKVEA